MATTGKVSAMIRNFELATCDLLQTPRKHLPRHLPSCNDQLQITSTPKTKRPVTPYRLKMVAVEIPLDESYCESTRQDTETSTISSKRPVASIHTKDQLDCNNTRPESENSSATSDSSSLNSSCLDDYMCSEHSGLYTSSYYDYPYAEEDSNSTAGSPWRPRYSDDSLVSLLMRSPATSL